MPGKELMLFSGINLLSMIKTKFLKSKYAFIIISAGILLITGISCNHHSDITAIKETVKNETKNIVVNIKISKFRSSNRRTNKNLSQFNNFRQKELNEYADTLKSQANEVLNDLETNNKYGRPSWKYGLYVTDTVMVMIPESFISILQTESTFTGGAHPNNIIKNYNYDLRNNKLLKKSDIINLQDSIKINKLLYNAFSTQNKYNIELFEQPTLKLADAIAITPDSIIFVYNQYTLACYAAGVIKINVSPDLIGNSLLINVPKRIQLINNFKEANN